jgi:hypothetical protein
MNSLIESATKEIQVNHEAYLSQQAEMEEKYFGKYLLMHEGRVVLILNDNEDAYQVGCEQYGLGKFSIEKVGEKPVDIGIHTLCL